MNKEESGGGEINKTLLNFHQKTRFFIESMQLAGIISRGRFRSCLRNELLSFPSTGLLFKEKISFSSATKGERTGCLGRESSCLFLRRNDDDQSQIIASRPGRNGERDFASRYSSTDSKGTP